MLMEKIKAEINIYQQGVAQKLNRLISSNSISKVECETLKSEARITAQAILDALNSVSDVNSSETEYYIYTLLDRYKSTIDSQLDSYETRERKNGVTTDSGKKQVDPKTFSEIAFKGCLPSLVLIPVTSFFVLMGRFLYQLIAGILHH